MMPPAEIVVLPVVRSERLVTDDMPDGEARASVTDINAFRYLRERAAAERRLVSSLIDETAP